MTPCSNLNRLASTGWQPPPLPFRSRHACRFCCSLEGLLLLLLRTVAAANLTLSLVAAGCVKNHLAYRAFSNMLQGCMLGRVWQAASLVRQERQFPSQGLQELFVLRKAEHTA